MRRPWLIAALLLALSLLPVRAQETSGWRLVAPEGEEFSTLMPESAAKVAREIPFGKNSKAVGTVYESSSDDTYYAVISFERSGAGRPDFLKSHRSFTEGFIYAFQNATPAGNNAVSFKRVVQMNDYDGQEFDVRVGGHMGIAHIYQTKSHFYVVMLLGEVGDRAEVERFFDSFSLRGAGAPPPLQVEAADTEEATPDSVDMKQNASAPKSPWPIASATATPDLRSISAQGGILNGKVINFLQPDYPPEARAAGASGTVLVQVLIDEEGKVVRAEAVMGHPLLRDVSVEAARRARFEPTRLSGQPVKITGRLMYNFVLK